MRGRALTLGLGLMVVAAVAWSLRREERFVVENPRLERSAGGARVAGTLVNLGEPAGVVNVEVTLIDGAGRPAKQETIELKDVAEGSRVAFASAIVTGEIKTYSIQVHQGKNPYGN